MKVVFIAFAVENLPIEFLSSYIKKNGHDIELVFDPCLFATEAVVSKKLEKIFDIGPQVVKQVLEKKPDLIAFSVFTCNYQRSLKIAGEIKRNSSVPIIFGGIHPTSVPEEVIKEKCVDIVCVGEGEEAMVELLESIGEGKTRTNIKNLWFKKNGKVVRNKCRPLLSDLDNLPFLDKKLFYDIYPGFISNDYYTSSSRGCPFACTYCANNVLRDVYRGLGRPVRRRSPRNIVAELVWAKKEFPIKQVTFVDDVFVEDVKWLKEFVKDYKMKVGLPYVMITHPLFISEEIVKLLKDSGCYFLLFGIQSASERTRREILKRFEKNEDIIKAADICHKYKLLFSVDHIFNIPGEGLKEQEEALILYNHIRPTIINSYWLQYFPRTPIIENAVKQGIIKKEEIEKINKGLTSTSVVVGIGNKDTFSPDLVYTNFQFYFLLLPVLPKWFTENVIKNKWYLSKFKPPMWLNVFVKFFISIAEKRGSVYGGIIRLTLFFARKNILTKLKSR